MNDKELQEVKENDNVDHPSHYNREGGMECIDEMILIFGKEAVKNFCLCNVWKYRYRAADKNGAEDLVKSDWYIDKYKELTTTDTIAKPIFNSNTISITPVSKGLNNYQATYGPTEEGSCNSKTHCNCGHN